MIIVEKIVNVTDQTEEIIEREATPAEIAEIKAAEAARQAAAEAATAKEAARQAVLEKLGLTADEVKTLLG